MYRSTPNSSLLLEESQADGVTSSETSFTPQSASSLDMAAAIALSKTTATTVSTSAAFVLMGVHARAAASYSNESTFSPPPVCSQHEASIEMIGASTSRVYLAMLVTNILLFVALLCWLKANDAWKSISIAWPFSNLSSSARTSSNRALCCLSRVTSVDAIKNISKNLFHSLDSCTLRAAVHAITRKECFARSDYIERLSINDVALLYTYASSVNLVGFEKTKFLAEQTQIVRSVITAMDMAVKVSRGCLVEASKVQEAERSEGDVDALYFVAATRIFAEWRTLRLVPQGYQRYAVGLSLGYRDILQNLEKIERGVHAYHQDQKGSTSKVPSPTLKELMQYELDTDVHKKLPKLEETSAASGLLWTRRQLHYQVATFNNSLEVPTCYPTAKAAASAAYRLVYSDYHGIVVKQLFTQSFGGSPPLSIIWSNLDPPKDMPKTMKRKSTTRTAKKPSTPSSSFGDPPERTLSDVSSDSTDGKEENNQFLLALENMNRGIVEKWEDMLRMFNCGTEEKNKERESLVLSSQSHFNLSALEGDNKSASSEIKQQQASSVQNNNDDDPIERSKRDTEDFVHAVSPMISDLGVMIDGFDMNDPSRV